ncbi:MAG TPA: response regulator transcription factor [Vicinamibacterales bacterium]|jgi:DNA-binding NarL/FixJ family response regulator
MTRARILVADDHPSMLTRVVHLLSNDYDIVGEASDGIAAVEAYQRLKPDLCVFDISMPEMTGFEAARRLQQLGCTARIVFLTVHEDPEFVDAARNVGAVGYVLKRNILTDLLPVVRRALANQVTFLAPLTAR